MTELLTRPPAAAARIDDENATGSLWWRGSLAALWAVAVGVAGLIVVALVAWAADSRSGAAAGDAIRSALQLWLVAHKVPLRIGGGAVALPPLGLSAALGVVVARAAAVLARGHGVEDLPGVVRVATAIALPYSVLAAFVAAAANSTPVRPAPVAALAGALVVGAVAAGLGAARGAGLRRADLGEVPLWLRASAGGAAWAIATLAAAATLLVVGSLLVHAGTAAELLDVLGGGLVGATLLVLLNLALLPNAAITAIGYLAGPGFAVGTGTSVTMGGAHLAAVPSLPLLAALPHGAAPLPVRLLCLVALVVAGAGAGWRIDRAVDGTPLRAAGFGLGAGVAAGLVVALLTAVAAGPAGPGRMASVGASSWQTGLAVMGEIGLLAAVTAAGVAWRRARRV